MIDKEVSRTFDRRSALFLTGGAVLTSVLVLRMLQMQLFNYQDYKKKSEIIRISQKYKDVLSQHELYATGTTGTMVMGETGLKITRMKFDSLLANDYKAATKEIMGTCVSMGITVDGKDPRDAQKAVDAGEYDDILVE